VSSNAMHHSIYAHWLTWHREVGLAALFRPTCLRRHPKFLTQTRRCIYSGNTRPSHLHLCCYKVQQQSINEKYCKQIMGQLLMWCSVQRCSTQHWGIKTPAVTVVLHCQGPRYILLHISCRNYMQLISDMPTAPCQDIRATASQN